VKKIVITGTAGFIGFHLAKRLLAEGREVVGIDNFNTYYPKEIKESRDEILRRNPNFTSCVVDISRTDELEEVFKNHEVDLIINLAAQAGVRYARINPMAYVQSNQVGFLNILEMARHYGVKRVLYASSSSVYAGVKEAPFREDQYVDRPISLYGATKKSNELAAHCYSHLYGIQTIGLRFFTVYGPWGRPDMAMWIFTEKMLAGKPIPVFNYGKMSRDFTYIDDIVDGVAKLSVAEGMEPYEIMNIGNHRSEQLMDLIDLIAKSLGVEVKCDMLPMMTDDVPATYASIDRINKVCGFEPKTTISEGIPRFLQWYKEHPELAELAKSWRESS
jgi:UDP-glucuronate 4-epimerase